MPRVHLTQQFADNPPVPKGKPKVDYFDTQLPGFLLEVRATVKATYYQRYREKYGRLKQARIGPTYAVAIDTARQKGWQIRQAAVTGFDPNAEMEKHRNTPTLKEFIDEKYMPHVRVYKRSWQMDRELIDRRIAPLWGKMKISEISRDDIRDFQGELISQGLKPGSVNRYIALVKFIFSLAEKWEIIDKSPARGLSMLADNNHKERYLTRDETIRLLRELKSCQSKVVPDLIEFLILTGARKSEAANARWEDIDFERSLWTVPISKSGKPRYIPLSMSALKVLERRRPNNSDYVFPNPNPKTGRPVTSFHRAWDRIRKNAGMPYFYGLSSPEDSIPEKLLILTDPSGKLAITSSLPPMASIWDRRVEIYISVRFSSFAMDGCCTFRTSASIFCDNPLAFRSSCSGISSIKTLAFASASAFAEADILSRSCLYCFVIDNPFFL